MNAIELKNVSIYYKLYSNPQDRLKEALHPFRKKFHKKFYALKNINLEVKKGEILGIVGRNGAGKSTLLKLISGIIQPNSGNVTVNGKVSALLELGAGLNPEFTGIQNIHFVGTMMGFSRNEMEDKINEIVTFAEIGDFIHQPLKTYSSGMKARLGFALAINMDPEILILDEVLAVGDELFRRKCYAKMEEFFKSGSTTLFVTHSVDSVNEICSHAILLDKGKQILAGPPKMTTMYYKKYLFAKPQSALKVRNEIIQLDKDEEKKKKFTANIKQEGSKPAAKEETDVPKQKSFFIPNYEPKSKVEYKNYDVDIYDIHIRTLEGEKVNALVMNDKFIYSFKVKFNIDAEKIFFGSRFYTLKGINISGLSTQKINMAVDKVKKGEIFLVEYSFDCTLLPGIYSTDTSVFSKDGNGVVVYNRVLDPIVFKVQDSSTPLGTGLVSLNQEISIKKL